MKNIYYILSIYRYNIFISVSIISSQRCKWNITLIFQMRKANAVAHRVCRSDGIQTGHA